MLIWGGGWASDGARRLGKADVDAWLRQPPELGIVALDNDLRLAAVGFAQPFAARPAASDLRAGAFREVFPFLCAPRPEQLFNQPLRALLVSPGGCAGRLEERSEVEVARHQLHPGV